MSLLRRKSAFGRTDLFHSDDTVFKELQSSASAMRQPTYGRHVYHTHGHGERPSVCWTCCHPPLTEQPFRIPRLYDAHRGEFHVYGVFCSLECCKAYIMRCPLYEREQHMHIFHKMCRDVYGVDEVTAAPHMEMLQMFGGPYTIDEFRSKHATHHCMMHHPPLVAHIMIVEERMHDSRVVTKEPPTMHMFPAMGSFSGTALDAQPDHQCASRELAPCVVSDIRDSKLTNRYQAFVDKIMAQSAPAHPGATTEEPNTTTAANESSDRVVAPSASARKRKGTFSGSSSGLCKFMVK